MVRVSRKDGATGVRGEFAVCWSGFASEVKGGGHKRRRSQAISRRRDLDVARVAWTRFFCNAELRDDYRSRNVENGGVASSVVSSSNGPSRARIPRSGLVSSEASRGLRTRVADRIARAVAIGIARPADDVSEAARPRANPCGRSVSRDCG